MTAQGIEAAQADETRSGSAVGESPTRRDAPPSPPLPPEGLPEEIIRAIGTMVGLDRALGMAIAGAAMSRGKVDIKPGLDRCNEARTALTTTILHHLSAAQRCCDSYARENQQLSDKTDAALARAERAEKALKTAQSALAMLTEPNEIRSTSVANAWAIAVDAELQCRRALSASVAEEA